MSLTRTIRVAAITAIACLSATTAFAAAGPTGTYKTKIGASVLGGQLKGTWTISFAAGRYTVTDNGTTVIHGTYTTSGHHISLGHEHGKDACPSTGTYAFKLTGKTLKLTRVSDSNPACIGRTKVLASTFTKAG